MRFCLVVYATLNAADAVRAALANAGAGRIGTYDSCSFSSRGTGRFRPLQGSNPAIGTIGSLEQVEEERIEAVVEVPGATELRAVIAAVRAAHPYEEPAIMAWEILSV